MAYHLGPPGPSAGAWRTIESQEFSEEKKKLGPWAWDGLKRFSAWTWETLKDTFGDRASEVLNTATDILVQRGEAAVVRTIEKGPGTQEEKDRLIVAAAAKTVNQVEGGGGGALIPIVIAALSIGVLFGGRK